MNSTLVTRDSLRRWGFVRLTDAWLYSSSSRRREYFETWHNSQWNCRVHLGFPEADPLQMTEAEFLQRLADELVAESELNICTPAGERRRQETAELSHSTG